jgi:hypothetical protein
LDALALADDAELVADSVTVGVPLGLSLAPEADADELGLRETDDASMPPFPKNEPPCDSEVGAALTASFPRVVVLMIGGSDTEEALDESEEEPAADVGLSDADVDKLAEVAAVPRNVELEDEPTEEVEDVDELVEVSTEEVEDADELADDDDVLPLSVVVFPTRVLSSVNAIVGLLRVPPEYTYPWTEALGGVGSPHFTDTDLTRAVKCPPAAV